MQVLTYGILTAAVLRAIIVLLGVELIDTFQPVLLGFAAILIYSSAKILLAGDEDEDDDLSDNNIVKLCRQVPHLWAPLQYVKYLAVHMHVRDSRCDLHSWSAYSIEFVNHGVLDPCQLSAFWQCICKLGIKHSMTMASGIPGMQCMHDHADSP